MEINPAQAPVIKKYFSGYLIGARSVRFRLVVMLPVITGIVVCQQTFTISQPFRKQRKFAEYRSFSTFNFLQIQQIQNG